MAKIFISYRRADSRKDAGRIYDRLAEVFGKDRIFKDVDSIPIGLDFRRVLSAAVADCDVLLAIIGRQWLNIADESGNRRLDNPDDFVRIEIESALQRVDCLVVPVLVDNASMPHVDELPFSLRPLAFKNAIVVRDDPDFHRDVTRLIDGLKPHLGLPSESTPDSHSSKQTYLLKGNGTAIAAVIGLVGVIAAMLIIFAARNSPESSTTQEPQPTTAVAAANTDDPTHAPTATNTLTPTSTPTDQPTATPTATDEPTASSTPTNTPVPPTNTPTPTDTPLPPSPTDTPSLTYTPTIPPVITESPLPASNTPETVTAEINTFQPVSTVDPMTGHTKVFVPDG